MKQKNYRSDETLNSSKKYFVIVINLFIRKLIFDHILATPTSDTTILNSLMYTTDETVSPALYRFSVLLPPFWPD